MHRKATDVELLQDTETKYINADGTIFKGIYEILRESGDTCKDAGGKQMVKECSKARRRAMGCVPDSMCTKNARCCLQNTLRWRTDFAAHPKVPTWTNMWIGWGKIFNAHDMYVTLNAIPSKVSCTFSVTIYAWLTLIFSQSDFWNCTKRYSREMCDYTVSGLQKVLPEAFLQVTPYWRLKAFERTKPFFFGVVLCLLVY